MSKKSPTINGIFDWLKKNCPSFFSGYRYFVLGQIEDLNLKKLSIKHLDFAQLMVMPIYDFIFLVEFDIEFRQKYVISVPDEKNPIDALKLTNKEYKKYKKEYTEKINKFYFINYPEKLIAEII